METTPIPFYSDVDGTLINTDLLIEGVCIMLKRQPWKAFVLPLWALRGKAFLKARVADHASIEPSTLPYNAEFVEFLRCESEKGREIYLASASEERFVSAIADHLGFVRGVVATAHGQNLKGAAKAHAILAHCSGESFAYAGDKRADLLVWREAAEGVLVNTSARVERSARNLTSVIRVFRVPKAGLVTYLKAVRMHQWLKNLLVFVPLVAAHRWKSWEAVTAAIAMFMAFGLMASGTYVINDLLDLPSDRRHPSKRRRPIASGQIPLATAAMIAVVLMLLGAISAILVSTGAALVLGTYLVATIAYSLYLKTFVIVDALTLAGLYTLRIIGGAIAIVVTPTVWLLAFSGFLFLSLGLLKRCAELDRMAQLSQTAAHGRGYLVSDDTLLKMMGVASGYIAVLVAALYIDSSLAAAQYRTPEALWLICPLLLYWVSRMWIKTSRGEMHDDPLVYSARDRASWIIFAGMGCAWLAALFAF
jgi:4-hydroxybenzoate polyprenyltransferase/phosphoserine phosphatase